MYQHVTVNGQDAHSPLGAMTVGTNQTVSMTPKQTIHVFLSAFMENQAIRMSTVGQTTTYTYMGPGEKDASFVSSNNTFTPA